MQIPARIDAIARLADCRVDTADHIAKLLTPIRTSGKPVEETRASRSLAQIRFVVVAAQLSTRR